MGERTRRSSSRGSTSFYWVRFAGLFAGVEVNQVRLKCIDREKISIGVSNIVCTKLEILSVVVFVIADGRNRLGEILQSVWGRFPDGSGCQIVAVHALSAIQIRQFKERLPAIQIPTT